MHKLKSLKKTVLLALILLLIPVYGAADQQGDWEFSLAPLYLWAMSIEGDLGVRARNAQASVGFDQIWDNLEGVFTVRFNTLYKRKFGLVFDYNYLDLGTEAVTDLVKASASFKSQIINLAGSYRFIDGPHTLDGAVGIRYTKLETKIQLRNAGVTLDGDQDWVDPVVGLRYDYNFTDKWTLRLYGDVGGFGAASDFTWQALGLIDFQPWKNVAFVAGYRAIGTDYETGSGTDQFSYDATVHGPVVGVDIRW